jgi:hypothetical protein
MTPPPPLIPLFFPKHNHTGEIQKYEAVVFISVLIGMVACCLFSCAYKRIQVSLERRRRRAVLDQLMGPQMAASRHNVFSNSLVENGEEDWSCGLCGFTNRPRTFECNLCGLDRDKMLVEYDVVCKAARELMEGKTVTSMRLTDRQLRGARRLLWRKELRQVRGGYHGTPLGSNLDNWKWVRNTPPPLSQDVQSDYSLDKTIEDLESGDDGSFSSGKSSMRSPRRSMRNNPLLSIFGAPGESADGLKSPLIDETSQKKVKSPRKGVFATAKSLFTKQPPKPLIFDSISRFAVTSN